MGLSLLVGVFLSTSCLTGSMPNLEKPQCTSARDVVKRFYSIHFGGDMRFSQENLIVREKFLTKQFAVSLQNINSPADVFTSNNEDYPRAFRLGGCEVLGEETARVEILVFWKSGDESRQQSVFAEVTKESGNWLINNIFR
jgi:hypothetical protein